MTREELKQEAKEKLLQAELDYCHELSNPCEPSELPYSELLRFETGYKRGYLASAEPREKRIAEQEELLNSTLEENKEIYKKMADLDTALEDCTESLTDARIKIKELEQENTELNKKLFKAEEEYDKMFWNKNEIISKAKELLKKLYNETRGYINDQGFDIKILAEAEQFLKESE